MRISLMGPRDAGKTCCLYLMLPKLKEDVYGETTLIDSDYGGACSIVLDAIANEKWPAPSGLYASDLENSPPTELRLSFKDPRILRTSLDIRIKDVSGSIFEYYSKQNGVADRTRRAKKISRDKLAADALNQATSQLEDARGIILFLDMKCILVPESSGHVARYVTFINNLNNSEHKRQVRECPLLVLLNKSDLIGSSDNCLHGTQGALEYLLADYRLAPLAKQIQHVVNPEKIIWAWHSTTGGVLPAVIEGEEPQPDYKKYHSLDPIAYTAAFLQLIQLINGGR